MWLNQNDNRITIDYDKFIKFLNHDTGPYPLIYGYQIFKLTEIEVSEISDINPIDYTYSHLYHEIKDLATPQMLQQLHNYLLSLLSSNPQEPPQFAGWTYINTIYTPFTQESKGLGVPRAIYKIGKFTITTPSGFLFGIWPYHYVTAYDDISMEYYIGSWHSYKSPYWRDIIEPYFIFDNIYVTLRNFVYVMTNDRYHVEVASDIKSKENYTYVDIPKLILNIPSIMLNIMNIPRSELSMDLYRDFDNFISGYRPLTDLAMGQRESLQHYANTHPEIFIEPLPRDLPVCIEDYVNFNLVPEEFKSHNFPRKVDNVYNLLQTHTIWGIFEDVLDDFAEGLDENDPNYRDQVIALAMETERKYGGLEMLLRHNFVHENVSSSLLQYALIAMGANPTYVSDIITTRLVLAYADIMYAGGLDNRQFPLSTGFINYICDNISQNDALNIIGFYIGIKYTSLVEVNPIDALRIMLTQGSVYPLPGLENADQTMLSEFILATKYAYIFIILI